MSTLKKVISLVLCLSMLTGVLAVLGAPIASAVNISTVKTPVTHTVRSVAELNNQYGDRGYYYLGLEFYEYGEDGKTTTLSDGYVDPGQTLQVKIYMKTSFYFSQAETHYAFDRNFFDISNGANRAEDKSKNNGNNALSTTEKSTDINYYTEGKAGSRGTTPYYVFEPTLSANEDYVLGDESDITTSLSFSHKRIWAGNDTDYFTDATETTKATSKIGFDLSTVRGWDLCEMASIKPSADTTKNFKLDSDTAVYSFDIKVRKYDSEKSTTELAKGTAGSSTLCLDMFKLYGKINPTDSNISSRRGDVSVASTETGTANNMLNTDLINADNFDFTDCNWTFIIGENPVTAGKYSATFIDASGEILGKGDYEKNATVTPPAATKEGAELVAWVDTATGEKLTMTESGSVVIPKKNGVYKPLFSTDKFKITFDLGGGKINGQKTYVKEVAYGEEVNLNAKELLPVKEHNDFVAWLVKTGPGNGYISKTTYKHESVNDVTVSAIWSKTKYVLTFMIMDYSTGNWKEYTTKSGYYGDTGIKVNEIVNNIKASDANWSGKLVAASTGVYDLAEPIKDDETGAVTEPKKQSGTIEFTSTTTYYIYTAVRYTLTVRVPTFDAETKTFTTTFTDLETESDVYGASNTGIYTYSVPVDKRKDVVEKPGDGAYEIASWTDADGQPFTFTENGAKFNITPEHGSVIVATANYKPYEYQVCFYTQNLSKVLYTLSAKVGEEIDLTEGELEYMADKTTPVATYKFPTEGVESSQQADGAKNWAPVGYRFDGWYLTSDASKQTEETKLTFPLEITESMVASTYPITMNPLNFDTTKKTLMFYPKWTAIEYPVNFYITNAANEKELYTTMNIAVGTNISPYIDSVSTAAEKAKINAKAPEGKTFSIWKNESAYVLAGGMDVVAQYTDTTFTVYIDLNNGREDSKPSSFGTAVYGTDPEFEEEEIGGERGAGLSIRKRPMYNNDKPIGNYEIIGWKVFYLEDPADINNPENWKEGYSPNGERKAYAPIVYQAQWISHDDLLFRTYDTAGVLYSALSKSFKRYYWSNNTSCDKSEASINAYPDTQFVAFITPTLENFEWSGFFSADMWSKVSLRFDAKGLANDTFSPENIAALIRLLISLIKGEEELPEL